MGALLSLPITLLNFLLPFTKPGTPILQDLVHTAILCSTLYYGPQIAEWYNTRQLGDTTDGTVQGEGQDQSEEHDRELHQAQLHNTRDTPQEPPRQQDRNTMQPHIEDEDELPAPQPGPARPQQLQPPFEPADFPDAGPANPDRPRPTPANRAIGAKKAKSLARKDQRRAYHEFHRQEAELRRLQEAEGRDEREAALAAEKARRAAAEAEIREAERREREEVKREREKEAEEEQRRRERVVEYVREQVESRGAVDLADAAYREGKDLVWVEKLVRASGLVSQVGRKDVKMLITSRGWLVRVDREVLEVAYKEAEDVGDKCEGKVGFDDFAGMLERAVRVRGGF